MRTSPIGQTQAMALAFIILIAVLVIVMFFFGGGIIASVVEWYRGKRGEPPTTRTEHPASNDEPEDPAELETHDSSAQLTSEEQRRVDA